MKTNLKECLKNAKSGSWKITEIRQTRNGFFVKCETRFFQGFEALNSFSGYFSEKYLSHLCREYFGKKITEMNAFHY